MPELARAYVQIIPSAEGIKGRLTETLGGEAEAAGESAGQKAGSSFGSIFGKLAGAGLAAAATGVSALAKNAVSGFAEYEQLVGGLETMFEDLSYDVEQNASNAFRTAGLSANEYMSTVMGFSASLNQSLIANEGNIARAADLSDQIIIDMADNANKMGTSMESIQNAYSGFAKQNFTMLDNLKLGYGGTKEEMERLLSDAEKLTGKKFDVSNFADIAEAIHAIQTEMGITGTTMQEGTETISGSISQLSAAWSNLVTGLATDGADIGPLIDNLVTSAQTAFDNLLPVITTALSGIGDLIAGLAPIIVETLPIIVNEVIPPLLETAASLIGTAVTAVIDNLPQIIALGLDVILSLCTGIADSLPELIPTVVDVVLQIVDTLTDPGTLGALVDASIAIIIALANGLINALPQLLAKAPEIVANLVTTIIQNAPKLLEAALQLVVTLATGIWNNLGKIGEAAGQIINTLLNGLASLWDSMLTIGSNIVQGVWQGISNSMSWIAGKISGWVGDVVGFFKSYLGIGSPSKVFAELGGFMAEGVSVGIEGNISSVEHAVEDMSDAAIGAWKVEDMTISGAASYKFGKVSATGNSALPMADAISAALSNCGVYMDGQIVGRLVTRSQANTARAYG